MKKLLLPLAGALLIISGLSGCQSRSANALRGDGIYSR